ncbi:hypothetical protein V6N13_033068 [Hibiscus sabdariffa]|uniref:Tyrosinase copper-binding domain-containing protein n=1 Tax=Hibiscus sabdariffa TaxID=183260 RepID=A0ABR2FBK3_9ROSI
MASTVNSPSVLTSLPVPCVQTSLLTFKKKQPLRFASKRVVSCRADNGEQNNADSSSSSSVDRFDRRDMLLGLGSLYGATGLVGDRFALASPISPDWRRGCTVATAMDGDQPGKSVHCCPPGNTKIIDFELPRVRKIRHRPAAHLVDCNYVYKFELAMEKMKALPDDDPRSFKQQAKIHCAYCNEAYFQKRPPHDDPDQKLRIHFSWLFFPFHRMYLYFYERILGELIGDPDFVMPFWNWDSPCGMAMPEMYVADPRSPLYDELRNGDHLPPNLVDLNDGKGANELKDQGIIFGNLSKTDQIRSNLCLMYRQMVSNSTTSTCFHGKIYKAGCGSSKDDGCKPEPGGGAIENGAHIAVHKFVGAKRPPYNEDMGNFYSAGRDPLFYAHHANVDRMWNIWRTLPGKDRHDFRDREWLNSSFLFYDEKKNLVRAKVGQFLDTEKLGYDYQKVDIPWLESKPTPRWPRGGQLKGGQVRGRRAETKEITDFLVLDKPVRVKVPRPKRSTTKLEEEDDDEEEEEVLVIQIILVNRNASVKFDVYVNTEDDETPIGPEHSEFAGSFTNIPHGMDHLDSKLSTSLTLAISELLKDLDAKDEEDIEVTLVPKEGAGLIWIGPIKIDYCT